METAGSQGIVPALLWMCLAVLVCFSALIANGRPLFYWDTIGYVEQGQNALSKFGLGHPAAVRIAPDSADPVDAATSSAGPRTVDGSRSLFYSVLSGGLADLRILDAMIVLHAIAALAAVWIPIRIACRTFARDGSVARIMGLAILASGLGSLPFFVAYLMPDIFAPVMILCIATLTIFGSRMSWWEMGLTLALGAVAVVAHLSHLGIAVLMVPLALAAGVIVARRSWWLAVLLTGAIVGAGLAQQAVIRVAAKSVAKSEVVIKPFLTARLIQDGPGWTYLKAHCPSDAEPTCALYAKLATVDDPWRRTASHIIFQTTQELGSFRLLPEADQVNVAKGQVRFFLEVLGDQPVATIYAFLKNTVIQSSMISVDMTIPSQNVVDQHDGLAGLIGGAFAHGRITRNTAWIAPLTWVQAGWYALAAGGIILLMLQRGVPREIKGFAAILVLGILVNAFVCGGISQPATRYGSRMIWLLPFAAAFMFFFRRAAPQSGSAKP